MSTNWLERKYYFYAAWDLQKKEQKLGGVEEITVYPASFKMIKEFLKKDIINFEQERIGVQLAIEFFNKEI